MKKTQVDKFYPWSAEYVIAHYLWRKSRGHIHPTVSYRGEWNPRKALALAIKMNADKQFEDVLVVGVSEDSFTREDGQSFGIQKEWHVEIKSWDVARFYGRGIGSPVRGLDINGIQCFYRTEEEQRIKAVKEVEKYKNEQKTEFEKNKESLDQKYLNLPEVFQRRIDKFRTNNPDFRWKYEPYEMFCCEQAVVIATAISKQLVNQTMNESLTLEEAKKVIAEKAPSALREFYDMSWEKRKETIPELADGYSGNTFGCSVKLAGFYISENPENVVKFHGALAPLVGSEKYGCVARV